MTWVLALAVAWVVLGGSTAVVMARRGHDLTTWIGLAVVLGPWAPVAAIGGVRAVRLAEPVVLVAGQAGRGPVDVLVGIDGSDEAAAALRAVVDLHRHDLGRLELAVVVAHEMGVDPDLARALDVAARSVDGCRPTAVVLYGDPATALARYAADEGFELLAVGARGRGRTSSPLGSAALRLASGAPVPVLIGPR